MAKSLHNHSVGVPRGAEHQSEDIAKHIPTQRTDMNVDADLAKAVQRAWRTILGKEPLPRDENEGVAVDGHIAGFSVAMPSGDIIYREAENPTRSPATEIVELGEALRKYALASPSDRANTEAELISHLNTFSEHWK